MVALISVGDNHNPIDATRSLLGAREESPQT